jgi:hypothetical protein
VNLRHRKNHAVHSPSWISGYASNIVDSVIPFVELHHLTILNLDSKDKRDSLSIVGDWVFRLLVLLFTDSRGLHKSSIHQKGIVGTDLCWIWNDKPSLLWWEKLRDGVSCDSQCMFDGSDTLGSQPQDFWRTSSIDSWQPSKNEATIFLESIHPVLEAIRMFQDEPVELKGLPLETLGAIHEHLLQRSLNDGCVQQVNIRKKSGTHFTPMSLCRQMVSNVLDVYCSDREVMDWRSLKICDPAMGCGAFLIALCRELNLRIAESSGTTQDLKNSMHTHEIVESVLYGVDIHPRATQITMVSLWLEIGDVGVSTTEWESRFKTGNSLLGYLPHELDVDSIDTANSSTLSMLSEYRLQMYNEMVEKKLTPAKRRNHWIQYRTHAQQIRDGKRTYTPRDHLPNGFHWYTEFASIFERGGFDIVVGNPPFVNAIRGNVPSFDKAFYQHRFQQITGSADLAYYFLELSNHLITSQGLVGFILPKVALGAPSLGLFRTTTTPRILHFPMSTSMFADANVQVVLLVVGASGRCMVSDEAYPTTEQWIEIQPKHKIAWVGMETNWWSQFWFATQGKALPDVSKCVPLFQSVFEVASGLITSEFYEVKVVDSKSGSGMKLLTSGGIDSDCQYWGARRQKFRKKNYLHPRISIKGIRPKLKEKLDRSRRPKIIIANQTKTVEAYLDAKGEYQASTATSEIYHQRDCVADLQVLLEWLHSDVMDTVYNAGLGYNALGEGISMGKSFLLNLPVPNEIAH